MFQARHVIQVATLAGLLFSSPSYADTIATSGVVYLRAEPGNLLGGAMGAPEVTWQHGIDGVFYAVTNYNGPIDGVRIRYDNGDRWTFDFVAPTYDPKTNTNDGQPLEVGFYDNAERLYSRSPTKPGMEVSGNYSSSYNLSGWFSVLEIAYGANGALDRFAVDFGQFDKPNQTGPSLLGSLRFNSAIAIPAVPEPATNVMLLSGIAVIGAAFGRRRSRGKAKGADSPVLAV